MLTQLYPHSGAPGFGAYVQRQVTAMRRAGVDVRVVQPVPRTPLAIRWMKQKYRDWNHVPASESRDGIDVVRARYVTLPRHWFHERVGDWLADATLPGLAALHATWPFDIVHAHGSYPCGHAAHRLRDELLPGVKVVTTVHRTCIVDSPAWGSRAREHVRAALLASDHTIFVSANGRALAEELTGETLGARGSVVANGVNPGAFAGDRVDDPVAAALRRRYPATFNILCVGYLCERKGTPQLLEALARLEALRPKRFRLFLVGRDELGPRLRHAIARLRLGACVEVVGEVAPDAIPAWMRFANAFVLPSHSEGIPTVLFESLAAGLPGVFSRVGGTPEIVRHEQEALLIDPGDPGQIARALLRLEGDPHLAARLGQRGRALVARRYTWERNAREVIGIYERILARAPATLFTAEVCP